MLVWVTGLSGTGKSSIAVRLRELGYYSVDADGRRFPRRRRPHRELRGLLGHRPLHGGQDPRAEHRHARRAPRPAVDASAVREASQRETPERWRTAPAKVVR
jgi:hypothetical protein